MKIKLLISVVLLTIATQLSAQEQDLWSLEKCVTYAIENNITIKQQALNVDYRQNLKTQSKFDMAPTANAQLAHDFSFGRSLQYDNTYANQSSQNSSFYIGSDVTLFHMFEKVNTVKQNSLQLQVALQNLETYKDNIALNVASAYLEILFNKELVSTSKEQLAVTKEQIEHDKRQVEAGSMAQGKLLETEAQAASEELSLTNYENQLKLSIINLQQMLELPLSDKFDILIPAIETDNITQNLVISDSVFAKAVLERPEIMSKEYAMQSYDLQVSISKAMLYPSLSVGASYYNNYNNKYERYTDQTFTIKEKIPFGDQFKNNRRLSLGFTLSIPIFNGLSARTNVKNSIINYENSKYELQSAKNTLRKDIEQVYANAIAAMKKYYSSEKAVNSAEEAFRYIQEKFNLGIVTPLEFNEAKNKVTSAKSSYIQAKYEYLFRVKILDFYYGKEIKL
jgi:outer membrane protein